MHIEISKKDVNINIAGDVNLTEENIAAIVQEVREQLIVRNQRRQEAAEKRALMSQLAKRALLQRKGGPICVGDAIWIDEYLLGSLKVDILLLPPERGS